MKKAMWIWDSFGAEGNSELVVFKKIFTVAQVPQSYQIQVCADSRYVLYVNGEVLNSGPARGGACDRYYDTVEIAPHLKEGCNEILAEVIHYAETPFSRNSFSGGPISVETTPVGGFLVMDGGCLDLSTDKTWESALDKNYVFGEKPSDLIYLAPFENRAFDKTISFHSAAVQYDSDPYRLGGLVNIWRLSERPIPLPFEQKEDFLSALYCHGVKETCIIDLLTEKTSFTVEANKDIDFLLDPGTYKTAFPYMEISGGAGAEIGFAYTEKFREFQMAEYAASGIFPDMAEDRYVTDGEQRTIRPLLYRAFRYMKVTVKTKDTALKIRKIGFVKTGYPLDVHGTYTSSDQDYGRMWKISLNTLSCCMYETYMDCPYYEQMQYAMDSFLQMLYTYQISPDDRLACKTIDDFARAQLFDGMFPCASPAGFTQIIPGFTVYWVMMLAYHYQYFGDASFVQKYIPELIKLLDFYNRHIDPDSGLIVNTGFWQFVDWVKEWERGCPSSEENNYIYSMMVSYAFRLSSGLFSAVGDPVRAERSMQLSERLNDNINKYAFVQSEQWYLDSPEGVRPSQHAQLWAVLSGACVGQGAKRLMERTLQSGFLSVSYCMSFFLFRALEKVGLYDRTQALWEQWRNLANEGCTTWLEDPVTRRSECHAWGAVPLYDFATCHLGVRPMLSGYEKVLIEPKALWLDFCAGTVATCKGDIHVEWTIKNKAFQIKIELPEKMNACVILPNHNKKEYEGVKNIEEFCIIEDSI